MMELSNDCEFLAAALSALSGQLSLKLNIVILILGFSLTTALNRLQRA